MFNQQLHLNEVMCINEVMYFQLFQLMCIMGGFRKTNNFVIIFTVEFYNKLFLPSLKQVVWVKVT